MKAFVQKYYSILFVLFLAVTVGLSFYLGYQQGSGGATEGGIVFSCPNTILDALKIPASVMGASVGTVEEQPTSQKEDPVPQNKTNGGAYVGSKNGTKYYTPGCPGTNRIKPENYVWFQTVQDATLQGYTKGSC